MIDFCTELVHLQKNYDTKRLKSFLKFIYSIPQLPPFILKQAHRAVKDSKPKIFQDRAKFLIDLLTPTQKKSPPRVPVPPLNDDFVRLLSRLEELMRMKGEFFRARAYQTGMETVMMYPEPIEDAEELKGQPGIGSTILKKLKEYQRTGTLQLLEREAGLPQYTFAQIYGIGPKKAKELVTKDKIKTIKQLRANQYRLLNPTQKKGLRYYEDLLKRIPRDEVKRYEVALTKAFKKVAKDGDTFEIVGSYRRGAKNSGDIDVILTNSKNNREIFGKFIDKLRRDGVLVEILSKGKTKSLTIGKLPGETTARRLDFMYAEPEEYAFSLLYFTGNKSFNVVQRKRAIDLGYTMNEHGLYHLTGPKKKNKGPRVEGYFPTEKSIFDFLGMSYKKPAERLSGSAVVLSEVGPSPALARPPPKIKVSSSKPKKIKKGSLLSYFKPKRSPKRTWRSPRSRHHKAAKSESKISPKELAFQKDWDRLSEDGISVVKDFSEEKMCGMIRFAAAAYYNRKPMVTDNVFDILKEHAEKIYPRNPCFKEVGAPTDKEKVKLPYQLHSMNKIYPDTGALPKYLAKYPGPKMISGKIDGISVLYANGKMYTRGRATEGLDISYMIPYMQLPSRKDVAIRGELIIKEKTFQDKYSAQYKNSRNMVAGAVNSKKSEPGKWKDLDFVAYEVIEPKMKPSKQFDWLRDQGVITAIHEKVDKATNELLSTLLVDWRENYIYSVDGIVVTDDKVYPRRNKNPEYAFAFKMVLSDQVAEVRVVDVIYTVSKDGYLKPVVRVEPVRIRGADIEYVTAHNAKFIKDNVIGIGAVIQLVRQGDVIPKIQLVVEPAEKAKMPSVPWKWNETHVDAIIPGKRGHAGVLQKNVEFFFKKLGVKGVGPGNVKRLIKAGFNTVPKILKMTKADLLRVEGFKNKTATAIRKNIDQAISDATLVTVASASNIFGRGIGLSILQNIIGQYPNIFESPEQPDFKVKQVATVENVGVRRAKLFVKNIPAFIEFLAESGLTNKLALARSPERKSHPLFGKRIVVSGPRDKALERKLISLGAKMGSSVSRSTFILLVSDLDTDSSKAEKAREIGVPIKTIESFKNQYSL